jgi:hypothetical protein
MKKTILSVLVVSLFCVQASPCRSIQTEYHSVDDSVKVIEKGYLHTDRDSYFAGDDIWFKAYLIDALDRLLTDHSSNLHVELISLSSKIISSRIIQLAGGLGNGDFKLSTDIKSGRYKLRAYTNYMRNFGDQLFFSKEISVLNSSDSSIVSDNVKYVDNRVQLYFFPEGGSLVENVSSVVAFKAVNSLGKGCDVSGKIYSSAGELITSFKSTHLGMGRFFLRPLPGLKYYSIARGADSIDFRTELPASFIHGVTISASINQHNELLITTKTNPETLTLVADHDLALSISIRKEVIKTIPYRIKSSVTNFVVPTDDLPDGILMLTLSGPEDLPLSERLIYIESEVPEKITIKTDKLLYNKREPVALTISLPYDSISDARGNVSLAVADKNLTDNSSLFPRNISSWFLLESDIRGFVEEPSYYFDPSNPDRLKDLDLLLVTQGWRDFAWKYDTAYFPPENGFIVSGRLRKNKQNKLIDDSRVSIGVFGSKNSYLKTVPVDSTGRFRLSGIDLTGEATIIASGIGPKDRPEGILTLDSVKYSSPKLYDSLNVSFVIRNNDQSKIKSYYKIIEAKRKKFKLTDTIGLGEVSIISELHKDHQADKVLQSRLKYINPDAELKVTEAMLGYPNIPELIRGKIPGVEVLGPKEGQYSIYIRGISTIHGITSPLVLIDGNKATYADLLIVPISVVDRIDVLKQIGTTVIYGLAGANGVINLITKAGGTPPIYKPVDYSARLRMSGYSDSRIFYSPQHPPDSNSRYNPDLRSTIYWNPDINLDGNKVVNLNYYNCDNASVTRITVEGITTEGIPVTGKAEYEVR